MTDLAFLKPQSMIARHSFPTGIFLSARLKKRRRETFWRSQNSNASSGTKQEFDFNINARNRQSKYLPPSATKIVLR